MGVRALPGWPSELIRAAARDLLLVEDDQRYRVNMWAWHQPDEQGETCQVCFAGAVLAKTVGLRPTQEVGSLDIFGPDTAAKLNALDLFRLGAIDSGLQVLGLENLGISWEDAERIEAEFYGDAEDRDFPSYHSDRESFLAAVDRMASLLEREGL